MENNITHFDMITTFSTYLTYANTFIVFATLMTAGIAIIITIIYNKDKKRIIEETTNTFLNKIIENEELRNNFINKILSNKKFMEEFNAMVDIHISDKMDRLVDIEEKSNIKELE